MVEAAQVARNAAVLVGNGLSVAFNPQLNLKTITHEMMGRIGSATVDGSDVVAAMQEIAERALPTGATSDNDFEVLVGAFGAESRTLTYLRELADLVSPQDAKLRAAIQRVTKFAEQVRDTGLSYVLEVIFERSQGTWADADGLHTIVTAITAAFEGQVNFGNLNYDTLLLSALLAGAKDDLADMGHGWKTTVLNTSSGPISVPILRREAGDFPANRRVRLLHLHGSLTFWTDASRTVFAKLDRSILSTNDQWQHMRDGKESARPVVVLANQRDKSHHVTEFPFSLAYEVFASALTTSEHWLIVGYSFRDTCINDMLRAEFSNRKAKPRVLVVTYGALPLRHDVERAVGWGAEDGVSDSWLDISRAGAYGMTGSSEWKTFIS